MKCKRCNGTGRVLEEESLKGDGGESCMKTTCLGCMGTGTPRNLGALIGAFTNEWRKRRVRIYADTEDPTMVFTEGEPLDGKWTESIETHEPRELFKDFIGKFNGRYR